MSFHTKDKSALKIGVSLVVMLMLGGLVLGWVCSLHSGHACGAGLSWHKACSPGSGSQATLYLSLLFTFFVLSTLRLMTPYSCSPYDRPMFAVPVAGRVRHPFKPPKRLGY